MKKRCIWLLAVPLLSTCGSQEATSEDIIAALCARTDQCAMTMRLEECKKSFRHGCREGESFDGEAAHACVQAIKTAACEISPLLIQKAPAACEDVCR